MLHQARFELSLLVASSIYIYIYIYIYISPNRLFPSHRVMVFLAKPTIQPVEGINLTDGLLDYSHKDNRGMKAGVTSTHDI